MFFHCGGLHSLQRESPPPTNNFWNTKKEKKRKRQWRGKLERCLDRWPLCIFFSSVNWSPFSDVRIIMTVALAEFEGYIGNQ